MANSQPYPQAGPSSIPYHHHPPYSGTDSSYQQPLPHYAPNHNHIPSGSLGQPSYVPNRAISSYPDFVPQQRHFRKSNRQRRFPQHHQQQPQPHLHFYQSQPMFAPPHALVDPYRLPPEYYPPELWTPPPFTPPQHPAYAYQPPYPPSTLPKQFIMPSYGRSPSSHASPTVLPQPTPVPEVPPLPEPSPDQSQEETAHNHEGETVEPLSENESNVAFPVRRNSLKGIALQSQRPRLHRALAVTISHSARPPASFIDLLDSRDSPSITDQNLFYTSTIDVVYRETTSPKNEPIPLEPSLASTATPETSTGAETPQIGSPHSSMTSVSVLAKTLPDTSEGHLELQAETSVSHNTTDSHHVGQSPTLAGSISVDSAATPPSAQPSSPPPAIQPILQPSQTVKKSWASLLRSPGSAKDPVNGLPTSSIQGFSIPATPPQETKARPTQSQSLVNLLTSTNVPSGRLPNIRARGLINLGNMCFANTVLQVLMYCPPFHKLFSELQKYHDTKESVSTPLINATIEFMNEFRPLESEESAHEVDGEEISHHDPFIPSIVYQALKEKKRFDSMRGGQQEDAEEFLGFFLDTLEEELSLLATNQTSRGTAPGIVINGAVDDSGDGWQEVGRKNKPILTRTHKTTESPISRIFGGKFRTTLKVPGSRESAMIDPWSRLQLDIQPDFVGAIEDALRYTSEQRTVQITSASKSQVDANQQTLIESLPPILILHLKRFLYDTAANDVMKLSKKITFLPELVIPKDVLSMSRRSQSHKYRLFGVLNHHGISATGGHYTLDVLHSDPHENGEEGWIRLDDDSVQNITVDDLLSKDFGDDRTAYLLFYRRV